MRVRQSHINALQPYLQGEAPRENGEWDMFCPLHEDNNRSASFNAKTGDWICFAGCGGGRLSQLLSRRSEWVNPPDAAVRSNGGSKRRAKSSAPEVITPAQVDGWCASLVSNIHAT